MATAKQLLSSRLKSFRDNLSESFNQSFNPVRVASDFNRQVIQPTRQVVQPALQRVVDQSIPNLKASFVPTSPEFQRSTQQFANVLQSKPLLAQGLEGSRQGIIGLDKVFNTPLAPAPQGTAQNVIRYGSQFGSSMAQIAPIAGILKGAQGIKAIQRPLGQYAGKLIAQGGAKKLLGTGVANLSQGIPYTVAYNALNATRDPKNIGKNLAGDAGLDLALGSVPLVGGLLIGKGGAIKKYGKEVTSGSFSNILDKGLRKEISDYTSKIKPAEWKRINNAFKKFGDLPQFTTLKELFSHDALFKSYPELGSLNVEFDPNYMADTTRGSFNPQTFTIKLNPAIEKLDEAKGTLLHEIQHAIQQVEGFARGGDSASFASMAELRNDNQNLKSMLFGVNQELEKAIDLGYPNSVIASLKKQQADLMGQLDGIQKQLSSYVDPYTRYQRLAGELESRAVQDRRDLTALERAGTDPYAGTLKAEGLKPQDLIVNRGDGASMYNDMTAGIVGNKPAKLPDATETLRQEARRYKSAEEFVRAQGKDTLADIAKIRTGLAKELAKAKQGIGEMGAKIPEPRINERVTSLENQLKIYDRYEKEASQLIDIYNQANKFAPEPTKPKGPIISEQPRNLLEDVLPQPGMSERPRELVKVEDLSRPKKIPTRPSEQPAKQLDEIISKGRSQIGSIDNQVKAPSPEEVMSTLPSKIDSFVEDVLGYTTKAPEGGTKEASRYTKLLRKGQEALTTKVEAGLGSENKFIRTAASTIQDFFKGAGISPERAAASAELRGGMATANERAFNVMDNLYKSLDSNRESLTRINAVLDPELATVKVSLEDLTPKEKQAYELIRRGLDLVHDTSYANGHISKDLYLKNRGKYTPRLYEITELPAEVNKFIKQGKRMVNDMYKSRKDIDAWKKENSLNDPVYSLGKRLSQVETNRAIKKYTDYLASSPRFISDIERPGFTKLSDSPAYGELAGKYVLNSAAEDLKGFFFSNQAMQNLYDVFRAYDRMSIRQLQKKLLTVFNPTTNVGNIVSNQVFGFLTGVDPLTLNKNLIKLNGNKKEYKQLADYLMRQNIVGTDITRTDFVNKLSQIVPMAKEKKGAIRKTIGALDTVNKKVTEFYGATDDVYKVAALKSLLDKGYSLEEATRRVADGFQNYANVGKFYDLWAKTPIVGSAFIKFQGDLIRIIKNGAVNNPLGLITFLGTLASISHLTSKLSGETPEDRETRENRFAAPKIPGLGISLAWQTPIGEVNAARYISPYYVNNETTGIAKMLPFVPTIEPNKDVASNIAMNLTDPLTSGPLQLLVDRDFRGKPISDPESNKYTKSLLTEDEKLANQAKFLGRNYAPPIVNSAIDVNSALQGEPNMYGSMQTPNQAIARLGGIKITQFGPEEAQKQRENDLRYNKKAQEAINKNIQSLQKELLTGDITEEEASSRIAEQQRKLDELRVGQKEKPIFEKTKDDPKTLMDKITLAANGVTKDPVNVAKAIFTEEELRKIEGNAVILKRQEFLNKSSDPNLELDHIIPLGLGGDNSESNRQYVTKDYHAKKTAFDSRLIRQLQNGEITRQEAQKQVKQFLADNPTTRYVLSDNVTDDIGGKSIIDAEKNEIKYIKDNGDIATLDVGKVANMPNTTGYEKAKKENAAYGIVDNLIDLKNTGKIDDETFNKSIESIGIKKDDAYYYVIASEPTDVKTAFVIDELQNNPDFSAEQLRVEVNGKSILTNAVIDNLYDEGLISKAEKNYLKNIGKDGKAKKSFKKKAKLAIPKVPARPTMKAVKSSPKALTNVKGVKLSDVSGKAPKVRISPSDLEALRNPKTGTRNRQFIKVSPEIARLMRSV